MYNILTHCNLFIGMDEKEIESFIQSFSHQVKKYTKDELIAISGEEITAQLIVVSGSVKGEMVDFTGKTIKIEDIIAPRPLAPAFLFGKNNVYPVNIVANESASILSIPKSSFIQMMQKDERVLKSVMNIISNRAQFLSNKIKFLSFQSIKGKLANYLLEKMEISKSDEVLLDKSQAQLAELFGVTRPSLGRTIREMDHEGVVEAKGRVVKILDKVKLSSLLR